MSKALKYIPWVLLIAFLLWERQCSSGHSSGGEKSDTTTVINNFISYDSSDHSIVHNNVYNPVSTIKQEVPKDVDTARILELYFAKNVYRETIKNDSLTATIVDTISQNQLKHRTFNYKWTAPIQYQTIIKTVIVKSDTVSKVKLYAGAGGGYTAGRPISLGPSLILVDKKDNAYTLTLDAINRGGQIFINKKISFKKQAK